MIGLDDTVITDPYGRTFTCREWINRKGGWENVGAEEAAALTQLGCNPGIEEPFVQEPIQFAPQQPFSDGGDSEQPFQPAPAAEQPFQLPAAVEQPFIQEPIRFTGPIIEKEQPVNLADFFTSSDVETNPIEFTSSAQGGLFGELVKAAGGALIGEGVKELIGQIPQYGVTVTPGASCWDKPGKLSKRARVKLVRNASGGVDVVRYCAPRRMNPCNARALGRAARRLGMFQKLSATVDKVINRQLKRKATRRLPNFGSSCGPRKGCR